MALPVVLLVGETQAWAKDIVERAKKMKVSYADLPVPVSSCLGWSWK